MYQYPDTSPAQKEDQRIAITGMGFLCPVGGSVWKAALALRKKRSSFVGHETVLVADNCYGTVLRGAAISRVPPEKIPGQLCGTDRVVALLSPTIRECTAGISLPLLNSALWQFDNLLEPAALDFTDRLQEALPELPLFGSGPRNETTPNYSRCVLFERIIQAVQRLQSGKEQMAIVGCADSLVTAPRLEELLFAGRLKDAVNPEGIMAGEAAGTILLEKVIHARQRKATIYATIASWGRGAEPYPWMESKPSTGCGLTEAFHDAFAMLDDAGASVGTVISDLNGERPRALEWALTEGRILPSTDGERILRHPADTLGDCGGAMGAAMVVAALAGFLLHHNAPRRVALTASDEAGARRVICLERGDRPDRRQLMGRLRGELNMEKPTGSKVGGEHAE